MRIVEAVLAATAIFLSPAAPVFGAVIIDSAKIGYRFEIDYAGQIAGKASDDISGSSIFTFTGISKDRLTYLFDYSMTNDSSVSSRLTAFGFNVLPDVSGAASTGDFASTSLGDNFPGFEKVDVCFEADKNGKCSGGNGGLTLEDDTGTGTFALTFAKVMESVTLDDFVTRFQSIDSEAGSSGIGVGALVDGGQPIVAPEPGTWLMMLGGFGMIGFQVRRRRASGQPLQAA